MSEAVTQLETAMDALNELMLQLGMDGRNGKAERERLDASATR